MKHFNTTHRTMLLWLMVLLTSLSSYAQYGFTSMVGDGFGGRAGYNPVNMRAGDQIGLAVCGTNKQLYFWGTGQYQRNNGTQYTGATAVTVTNATNVRFYTSNTYIKDDGTGYVYGMPSPYNTALITNAHHASAQIFVKTDGTVWAGGTLSLINGGTCSWTNNQPATFCVTQVPGITNAKRVVELSSASAAIFLLADGTVKTLRGSSGSYPASLISSTPITITGLSNIVDIKGGDYNACALTSSGQVYTWGRAMSMGTGVANDGTLYTPQLVTFPSGAAPIKAISSGQSYNLALDDNGNCYAWGRDVRDGGATILLTPTLVATNVRDMSAGSRFAYFFKNDGTVWGFGSGNLYGLMGLPNISGYYSTLTQLNPTSAGVCAIELPCVAGTTAPALTPTTATNSCPTATVDLTSLAISSTTPSGASLIWSTHKTPTSAADTLTTAQKTAVSTAGKYYAMYYDAANACYSPADSVDITITACPINLANACPTATVNLTTAISASNMPSGASITWHTGTPATTANQVSDPTAISTSGTYYLAFFDGINNCYGNTSQAVTVTITSCVPPLTANTPAAQTATTGTAKTGNAATELSPTGGTAPYTYSNGAGDAACVAPSGATALPAGSNLTVNSSTGAYTYTAPSTAGTYYYCIKVCDSTTPTPSCVVKTYTLTVSAPACTVTGVTPTFIKN